MKRSAWLALALVGATIGSLCYGRQLGLIGLGLGLAGGSFGAGALAFMVRLLAAVSGGGRAKGAGVAFVLLAVAAKIPVLLVLAGFARAQGAAAFDCFLAGVMLVYFGLVGWVATVPTCETPSSR